MFDFRLEMDFQSIIQLIANCPVSVPLIGIELLRI